MPEDLSGKILFWVIAILVVLGFIYLAALEFNWFY